MSSIWTWGSCTVLQSHAQRNYTYPEVSNPATSYSKSSQEPEEKHKQFLDAKKTKMPWNHCEGFKNTFRTKGGTDFPLLLFYLSWRVTSFINRMTPWNFRGLVRKYTSYLALSLLRHISWQNWANKWGGQLPLQGNKKILWRHR